MRARGILPLALAALLFGCIASADQNESCEDPSLLQTPRKIDWFAEPKQLKPVVDPRVLDDMVDASQKPLHVRQKRLERLHAIQNRRITTETFLGVASAVLLFLTWEFTKSSKKYNEEVGARKGVSDRWWFVIMSAMIQVVGGSVYAMGAWQNDLRDSLQISMTSATIIGAMAFTGNIAGFLGGMLFDRSGPRAAVCLGCCCLSIGYCLIGIALVSSLAKDIKILLAGVGSLLAGYASASLLDNITCLACAISFPQNQAAVVGYLKAVLATAGGLWALLWVQLFQERFSLASFMAISAIAPFLVGIMSLSSMKVLPPQSTESLKERGEIARAVSLIFLLIALTCFDVWAGYDYANGMGVSGWMTGSVALVLQMSPLLLLVTLKESVQGSAGSAGSASETTGSLQNRNGITFQTAFKGMDFWLLWVCQFAVFGAGVATNQNLALILETTGHSSASSLGVALFALTSAISRVAVGILSEKYDAYFTRFHWMTASSFLAMMGQFLVCLMDLTGIMAGTCLMGLSFGSFYTVQVPLMNEMYGNLEFGKMMGAQMSCQAPAALLIVCHLLPAVYRNAAGGKELCEGRGCFQTSFLLLTVLNAVGLAAAVVLQVRNSDSLPVTRLNEARSSKGFSS